MIRKTPFKFPNFCPFLTLHRVFVFKNFFTAILQEIPLGWIKSKTTDTPWSFAALKAQFYWVHCKRIKLNEEDR